MLLNRTPRRVVLLLAAIVAVGGAAAAAAPAAKLLHGFRAGDRTFWRTDAEYEMATVFDGDVKGSMSYRSSRLESYLVSRRYRDGSATLEMRVSDETIDGDGDPADRARDRAPLRARVRLELKVAGDGRVIEHKAHDVPDDFGSVDGLLEELRPMKLSGGAPSSGSSWTDESSLDVGGIELKIVATYEVTAVRADEGLVEIASRADVSCEMPEVPAGATAICTGSGTGKIVFDLRGGRLLRSEEELTVILGMEGSGHRIETRMIGRAKRELDRVEKAIPRLFF